MDEELTLKKAVKVSFETFKKSDVSISSRSGKKSCDYSVGEKLDESESAEGKDE